MPSRNLNPDTNITVNMTEDSYGIIHLLPGPVELNPQVIREFSRLPVSHRCEDFNSDFQSLRAKLCRLVNSKYVELLSGSGTLANDAIAAQLSLLKEPGLILSNGEFGNRIISQAKRFELEFLTFEVEWGIEFSAKEINDFLDQNSQVGWMWAVHSETSTGVLNNANELSKICRERNIKLCLDCISSVGIVPVKLESVFLASCSSGKALCSFPGLSMVFHNHEIKESAYIPKYLDLGFTESENGIPFTVSSNLVYALLKAMASLENPETVFTDIKEKSKLMRTGLERSNFKIINDETISSPAIITIELPGNLSGVELGKSLADRNCFISYNSGYLVKKNWVQTFITRNTAAEKIRLFTGMFSAETVK
jgi:aspartate aminotransferase-like enzyme